MIRRVAAFLILGGILVSSGWAQDPPAVQPRASTPRESLSAPIPTDPAHPNYHAGANRSIVRHNPLPYRSSFGSYRRGYSEGGSGYANPGGVGRYSEYYDPNTPTSQVDLHPMPVARFDSGGGPDRAEQIAAYEAGTARSGNLQRHIDAYGAPYGAFGAGFGYGLGLAGGRLYSYPY